MSVRNAARLSPLGALSEEAQRPAVDLVARRRAAARRRQLNVIALRLLVAVFILGGWELGARIGVIDKFFWSQPSEIGSTLWRWLTQGTELGPLWDQVLTTLE